MQEGSKTLSHGSTHHKTPGLYWHQLFRLWMHTDNPTLIQTMAAISKAIQATRYGFATFRKFCHHQSSWKNRQTNVVDAGTSDRSSCQDLPLDICRYLLEVVADDRHKRHPASGKRRPPSPYAGISLTISRTVLLLSRWCNTSGFISPTVSPWRFADWWYLTSANTKPLPIYLIWAGFRTSKPFKK